MQSISSINLQLINRIKVAIKFQLKTHRSTRTSSIHQCLPAPRIDPKLLLDHKSPAPAPRVSKPCTYNDHLSHQSLRSYPDFSLSQSSCVPNQFCHGVIVIFHTSNDNTAYVRLSNRLLKNYLPNRSGVKNKLKIRLQQFYHLFLSCTARLKNVFQWPVNTEITKRRS